MRECFMRVLVIGGTKFIGPAAVKRLHGLGHDVTVFHRGDTESSDLPDIAHLHGDRQHLADFTSDFKRLAPDVVLDTVAYTDRDARSVMGAFVGIARRIVVLSSMDVYRAYGRVKGSEPGPPDPVPLTEDAPLRASLYPDAADVPDARDYDNILVERAVMGDSALPGTVLRLPAVYGQHDYQHRLFPYLKRMNDRRPAIVLDEQIARWRWTRGYVDNVAVAIALAVTDERASGRVYNVGEDHALTEAEWVRAIGRAASWEGEVVVVLRDRLPISLRWWGDAAMEQEWAVDTSRLRAELGYAEVVPHDEALRRTVAWERANPPADFPPALFDYAAEDAVLAGT
jgi:nucleoside-diphosphate-sugar epimerase